MGYVVGSPLGIVTDFQHIATCTRGTAGKIIVLMYSVCAQIVGRGGLENLQVALMLWLDIQSRDVGSMSTPILQIFTSVSIVTDTSS